MISRGKKVAIQLETYEKMRYLYEQEGMSQRSIARQLSISRNTVKSTLMDLAYPGCGRELAEELFVFFVLLHVLTFVYGSYIMYSTLHFCADM